jgi:hypothetical protein
MPAEHPCAIPALEANEVILLVKLLKERMRETHLVGRISLAGCRLPGVRGTRRCNEA